MARNSFQLKASLMDLRAFADSASFTEKKAEKVQWCLRQVSLYANPFYTRPFRENEVTFTKKFLRTKIEIKRVCQLLA